VKWSEMKGFWSTEEIEYFQEDDLQSDNWNEVKWSAVKWSEVTRFWSTEEIEYFQEQGLESDKCSAVKWVWSGMKIGWVRWREGN